VKYNFQIKKTASRDFLSDYHRSQEISTRSSSTNFQIA
jgi:hypothetical protein